MVNEVIQILLRRASLLEKACSAAASKIEIETMLRLSVHTTPASVTSGDITATLESSSNTVLEQLEDVFKLYQARETIRRLIGEANSPRIDALLCERDVRLSPMEAKITAILQAVGNGQDATARRMYRHDSSSVRVKHEAGVVHTALTALRDRQATVTMGEVSDQVEVPALSPAAVKRLEDQLAAVKRRKADLMDELAAANLNQKITLPADVVAVLRKHGILEP